jgi:hypothetical protein
MNRDYSEGKIREALKISGGNATRARQQIIAWAFDDAKLLHELMAPHMTGIVAHAINHVMAQGDKKPAQKVPNVATAAPTGKDPFGMEILKAIALGNPAQFGHENGNATAGKQVASQRHIDAIKAMVAKGKNNK